MEWIEVDGVDRGQTERENIRGASSAAWN